MELIKYPDDMTVDDKELLSEYMRNNCPNLINIKESDVVQWFQLYMAGKTYTEIAKITNRKKELILYMANKLEWHNKRLKHYSEMSDNLWSKLTKTKIQSADTLTTMLNCLNKYYGEKFNKYLATNDKTIIEALDTKNLSQYYKAVDSLEKLLVSLLKSDGDDPKSPINILVQGNATIQQSQGEESLNKNKTMDECTEEDVSKALDFIAKIKRKQKE